MYKKTIIGAAVVAASLMLAACGGTSADTQNSSVPTSASASSSTSDDTMVGGNPATWTPVTITPNDNNSTIELVPGQAAVFDGIDDASPVTIQTSDPAVVEASQPTDSNGVVTTGGIQAKEAGRATVTVEGSGGIILEVTIEVTAEENGMVGDNAGTWTPIELKADAKGQTVEIVSGQAATWTSLPGEPTSYLVETDKPAVALVMQAANVNGSVTVPGIIGGEAGEATVKLRDANGNVVAEINLVVK